MVLDNEGKRKLHRRHTKRGYKKKVRIMEKKNISRKNAQGRGRVEIKKK